MPWTNFPVVDRTTNIQWHAFQIVSAMRERQTVVGRPLTALPVDRVTNIQDPAYWAGLQAEVDTLSLLFLDSAGNPGGFDGMAYAAPFTLPDYTQATFRSGAGLHANGWKRRYYSGGVETTAYGTMVDKDFIGTHTLNELYEGINILAWTTVRQNWATGTVPDKWLGVGNVATNWAGAKADLTGDWADSGDAPIGGNDVYYAGAYSEPDWLAWAERGHGKLKNTASVSTAFRRDADYYIVAQAINVTDGNWAGFNYTFSAHGDGVEQNKWKKVLTDSPTADVADFESGGNFGSAGEPTACTEPDPPGISKQILGYHNGGGYIVVRWDVTDGFGHQ